jgi:flagellar assembly factor FliW
MEVKNKYQSGYMVGGGKIHPHTCDKGEKFRIITMSAEKLEISTTANVNVSDIVTLKIQIKGDFCTVNIKAVGKILDKSNLDNEMKYTIEFVGMSDSDKEEIDELIRSSCDL